MESFGRLVRIAGRNFQKIVFTRLNNQTTKILKFTAVAPNIRLLFISPFIFQIAGLKFNRNSGNKKLLLQADELFDLGKYDELKEFLLANQEEQDEILWRLARAFYKVAKSKSDKVEIMKDLEEAYALVSKALELNELNGFAHKWYAIVLNSILEHRGTKEKITQALDIKHHLERAIALIPDDATTYHILGVWCYSVADLTWYEVKIASVIYATPPTTTFDEALKYFEQAENISPMFYNWNLLYLGKCYLKLNQLDKAKEFLLKAKEYRSNDPDDQNVHKEATCLLKKLGVN